MKTKLKNAYKPTPERFRYTVRDAVAEAAEQSPARRKRLSKGWRVAIAAVLIAALVPTTVFGASKLYELIAKPIDSYGLAIGMDNSEASKTYPEYVKMHVETPEGFAAMSPEPDNMNYYSVSASEKFTDGFSLFPMRFSSEAERKEYIGNVESYEERVIDGRQAYEVTFVNGAWSRLYVYYEDVNVFLLISHKDVTDAQLEDFVKGITFTEGTADDHTPLNTPIDERKPEVVYTYDESYVEHPLDTKLTFQYDESTYYTARLSNIRTLDNIAALDSECFNGSYRIEEIADENGNLIPKTVNTIKEGDGFSSTDELLSSESKDQVMVLTDITYTNLSDKDIELYIPYRLSAYNMDENGQAFPAGNLDADGQHIYMTDTCDTELIYVTPHGDGKGFYIPTLHANETLTVTIGSRCNADLLDKAYFTLFGVSDVTDPAPEGDAFRTIYLFKVQENDR